MPTQNERLHRYLAAGFWASIASGWPNTSTAGTSDPGGVAEGLVLVVAWVVALVALLAVALIANAKGRLATRNAVSATLAAAAILPIAFVAYSVSQNNAHSAMLDGRRSIYEAEEALHLEGLAKYCAARKAVLHAKPKLEAAEGVRFSYGPNFTGRYAQINAQLLASFVGNQRSDCSAPGISYVESLVEGKPQRIATCGSGHESSGGTLPRFAVVVGESGGREQLPWGPGGGKSVATSSVRIHDMKSNSIVAEDTLVFQNISGASQCEDPAARLNGLFLATFR